MVNSTASSLEIFNTTPSPSGSSTTVSHLIVTTQPIGQLKVNSAISSFEMSNTTPSSSEVSTSVSHLTAEISRKPISATKSNLATSDRPVTATLKTPNSHSTSSASVDSPLETTTKIGDLPRKSRTDDGSFTSLTTIDNEQPISVNRTNVRTEHVISMRSVGTTVGQDLLGGAVSSTVRTSAKLKSEQELSENMTRSYYLTDIWGSTSPPDLLQNSQVNTVAAMTPQEVEVEQGKRLCESTCNGIVKDCSPKAQN